MNMAKTTLKDLQYVEEIDNKYIAHHKHGHRHTCRVLEDTQLATELRVLDLLGSAGSSGK